METQFCDAQLKGHILSGHDNISHRTYGPDSVGVIGHWLVPSLRDAYDVEQIQPQDSVIRGLADASHIDVPDGTKW